MNVDLFLCKGRKKIAPTKNKELATSPIISTEHQKAEQVTQ